MPIRHLSDELDAIANGAFDYGIVPGSATVFIRDKIQNLGRFDLTLLEGVLVVIDVTPSQGYMVTSCSALSSAGLSVSTARTVQSHMNAPFDSLESLLLSISPVFCQRFQQCLFQKLQGHNLNLHANKNTKEQQQDSSTSTPSTPASTVYMCSTTASTPVASGMDGTGEAVMDEHQQQKMDNQTLINVLIQKGQEQKSCHTEKLSHSPTSMMTSTNNNFDDDNNSPVDDISEWLHP